MKAISEISAVIKTKKFWKELVIMTLGMMVTAAAVYYFLVPSKLIIGTISGFSIVLSAIFELFGLHIKVSVLIMIINAILLIMAYFLVNHEFGMKTVYTAMILGPMMDLWELIYPYQKFLTEPGQTSVMGDIWFDLCCFVFLLSASQAILFKINASTGGLDILAKIVNKYFHFDIGVSVSIAGAIICCSAFAINPFKMVVIGLIGTWINGVVVDHFTVSLNRRKKLSIVSENVPEIREYIINVLGRGCSIHTIEGGYTGEQMKEIHALMTQDEFSDLMEFIKESKFKAFINATNCSEVYGLWLPHKKHK